MADGSINTLTYDLHDSFMKKVDGVTIEKA